MSGKAEEEKLVPKEDSEDEAEAEAFKAGIPLVSDRAPNGKVKMTSTKDCAVMSMLCLSYGCEIGLLWPVFLHFVTQFFQFFLVAEFFQQKVLPLTAMFKSPQVDLVEGMINLAISSNTTIQNFNYSIAPWNQFAGQGVALPGWIFTRCALNLDIPQSAVDVLMVALIMLLFGKFWGEVSSFFENADLFLFQMGSEVDSDRDKDKSHAAIKKALETPASKCSITAVAMHVKIVIVVLIYLPHLICQVAIVFTGAQYILVQPTLGVMIKSALKIYFISKFSGIMLKAYTGENMKKLTNGAMMNFDCKEGEKPQRGWWQSVLKAVLIFVSSALMALIYIFAYGYPVHMVGRKCEAYITNFGKSSSLFHPPGIPTCLPGFGTPGSSCGKESFWG